MQGVLLRVGQQLKIMWQISELDLRDRNNMREQLVGVDMAYLHQVIAALNDKDPNLVNSTYVAEIIDRIFD